MVLFVSIAWLHHRGTLSGLALPWFVICHTLFFKCILLARTQSNNIISMNLVGNNAESTESWIHVPEWKALSLCPGALLYVCVSVSDVCLPWCTSVITLNYHKRVTPSLSLMSASDQSFTHCVSALLSTSAATFLCCRNTTQRLIEKMAVLFLLIK